jgi:DNA-binding transcriptional LysR family regulator
MKRTHLPLNGLRVLDAAARHLSFTRAADELAVTPAAVGQQIRALEDLLGVILFRRTSKGLELTDEAAAGLDAIREGFLHFEEGVQAIQAGQSSHVYTIACPRDFFAAWLSARLAAFRNDSPHLRFALIGSDGETDFAEANLDLAVRWCAGPRRHVGRGGPRCRGQRAVDRLARRPCRRSRCARRKRARGAYFGGRCRYRDQRRCCRTGPRAGAASSRRGGGGRRSCACPG